MNAVAGEGFLFDGRSGRISVPDTPALRLTTSLTIELDPSANPGIGIGNCQGYPAASYKMPFNGIIDELRVYNRALTQREIEQAASPGGGPGGSDVAQDGASAKAVRLPLLVPSDTTRPEAVASPAAAVPGPELHAFTAIELVWPSEAGTRYRVQWTPSIGTPQWVNLDPVVSGTGGEVSLFDSTREHPRGFYRVEIVP